MYIFELTKGIYLSPALHGPEMHSFAHVLFFNAIYEKYKVDFTHAVTNYPQSWVVEQGNSRPDEHRLGEVEHSPQPVKHDQGLGKTSRALMLLLILGPLVIPFLYLPPYPIFSSCSDIPLNCPYFHTLTAVLILSNFCYMAEAHNNSIKAPELKTSFPWIHMVMTKEMVSMVSNSS